LVDLAALAPPRVVSHPIRNKKMIQNHPSAALAPPVVVSSSTFRFEVTQNPPLAALASPVVVSYPILIKSDANEILLWQLWLLPWPFSIQFLIQGR